MRKMVLIMVLLTWSTYLLSQTGGYAIGETVSSSDNISWTIDMPDPYTGQTGTLFSKVDAPNNTPVLIFFGTSG